VTRSTAQRISDILDAIERCRRYEPWLENDDDVIADMAADAVERNLQNIGEAANGLPQEIIDAHPDIAWPQIRGMRNILVHQYFGVDTATVRDVIENHLGALVEALRPYTS
jgi:uncharacterized protein with HEPN domain